jgi:hypothetical protein
MGVGSVNAGVARIDHARCSNEPAPCSGSNGADAGADGGERVAAGASPK